jgi:hypothetical protein
MNLFPIRPFRTPGRHVLASGRTSAVLLLAAGILGGCTIVGPASISSGRVAYNEAIRTTDNQQMLMIAIHNRYEERGSLLAVASVTANVSVTTSVGIEAGFGEESDYSGNLVPFTGGVIYEENPTISYTPVQGQAYARQLMAPVPIPVLAQYARTISDPRGLYTTVISGINGIFNPDFVGPGTSLDPRFGRVVDLLAELQHAHRLDWVEDREDAGRFLLVIDHYAPDYTGQVEELLGLLGLRDFATSPDRVVVPVSQALDGDSNGGIGLTTRSVWDMVEILSAAIEIPADDQNNGYASVYPAAGRPGENLLVSYSNGRPDRASVAVKYRDGWFSINDNDLATKRYFRIMTSLWSVAIAETAAATAAAPVLTVPVSR